LGTGNNPETMILSAVKMQIWTALIAMFGTCLSG